MTTEPVFGNANEDGQGLRGWFIGQFIDDQSLRSNTSVEVKWGVHPSGEEKTTWTKSKASSTLVVLISGRFHLRFPNNEFLLTRQGDYVIFPPELAHSWFAEEATCILTVRWPSIAGDIVEVEIPLSDRST